MFAIKQRHSYLRYSMKNDLCEFYLDIGITVAVISFLQCLFCFRSHSEEVGRSGISQSSVVDTLNKPRSLCNIVVLQRFTNSQREPIGDHLQRAEWNKKNTNYVQY